MVRSILVAPFSHPEMSFSLARVIWTCGRRFHWLTSLALVLCSSALWGSVNESIEPGTLIVPELPAWINPPLSLPHIPPVSGSATYPTRLLVMEQQFHVPSQEQFSHFAMRIETEAGLQSAGQVTLSFAPSYQRLQWHYLRIWRAGAKRELLTAGALQVLRQEEDAERYIYHGRVTVLAIVHDLRVGDVIEYAFTHIGDNPVFAGRFSTVLQGASSAPVDRLFYRVLNSTKAGLQMAAQGGFTAEHRSSTQGDLTENTWQASDLKAVHPLTDAPSWEIQYPFLQLSEYQGWPEVVDWGNRLFELPASWGLTMHARVGALTAGFATREEKANALLHFVQDEIRYLAISIGESSHRPSPPAEVLERRFGDCKDKALLLVALLREIGLDAQVALVHSDLTQRVRDLQASPLSFDHAIVHVNLPPVARAPVSPSLAVTQRMKLHDLAQVPTAPAAASPPPAPEMAFGPVAPSDLWLDPTIGLQGGDFTCRAMPDYGYALVLAPGTRELRRVTVPSAADGSVWVKEQYTVTALDRPARLTVTTTYGGGTADLYRYYRRFSDPERSIKQLTGLLTRYYPKIKASGVTEWTDVRELNRLTARSTFEVPEFWQIDAAGHSRVAEVYPWALSERLPRPDTTERAYAFGLPYPCTISHEIVIDLPKDWPVRTEQATVRDDSFVFDFSKEAEGKRVNLTYRWRTLADSVPAGRMGEWIKKMAEVRALLGYTLRQNIRLAAEVQREAIVWTLVVAVGAGSIAGLGLGLWLYFRFRPAAAPAEPPSLADDSLTGLGGWLILVAIGVTLRPLAIARVTWPAFQLMCNWPGWVTRTDPESFSYVPGFAWVVLAETFLHGLFLAWSVVLVPQFYRRKASFPVAFAASLVGLVTWDVVDVCLMQTLKLHNSAEAAKAFGALLPVILSALIWVPYLFRSRRVKLTFRQ